MLDNVRRLVVGWLTFVLCFGIISITRIASFAKQTPGGQEKQAITLNLSDLKWVKMEPRLGDQSPLRAVLHESSSDHSMQFVIRMPKNFHVPLHWHNANETHTVIRGKFVMEAGGQKVTLGPGGFNYTPARIPHQAWTTEEGAVIFVTVDGLYDINVGEPHP